MKINFIAFAPEIDMGAWSGTVYMIYRSLQRMSGIQVNYVSCAVRSPWWHRLLSLFLNGLRYFHITGKRYVYTNSFLYKRLLSKKLSEVNFDRDCDLIFVAAYSSIVAAIPETRKPIIYLTDSTYSGIEDYYPEVSDLYRFSSRQANALSRSAFEKAKYVIVSSQWAKGHAVEDYKINPDKIHVIEFGANLEYPQMGKINRFYGDKPRFNILLSGVNWVRKGGSIAVECCLALLKAGIDVTLHVAGMEVPAEYKNMPFIKEYGFLNKKDASQYKRYIDLLLSTDILLLPTRAECAGIVFCEASAFGIPSFAYDTGGLANYVVNGLNGYRLPITAGGLDFADKIRSVIMNRELDALSKGASDLYNSRLNWDTWTTTVKELLMA